MSSRRGTRRGRSADGCATADSRIAPTGRAATYVSSLTLSIEERIEAALPPLSSVVAELTREVQKRKAAQQRATEESTENDCLESIDRKCTSRQAVNDWTWLEGSNSASSDTPPNPWMFQPSTVASMEKWPTFIATFRALVHDVLPSDAQLLAVLGQLLSPKLRSGFSGLLADPNMY
uniref:Uncharacterized protein n=1 Tax=Trichuris muris TaxID=70415 RepID=A0A5S6R0C3_TRIMR